MRGRVNVHVRREETPLPYGDRSPVQDGTIKVEIRRRADVDVRPIVAVERRLNPHALTFRS